MVKQAERGVLTPKKADPIEGSSGKRKFKRQDTGLPMGHVTSFGAQQKENSPLKTVKKCPEFPKDENAQPNPSPTKRAKHSAKKPKIQNNENSLSPIKLRQLESGPVEQQLVSSFASLESPQPRPNLFKHRKESRNSKLDDIKDLLSVEKMMSFGKFISSKILGSHLVLTNKSSQEQIFEIAVDSETERYCESTSELLSEFVESELPFKPEKQGPTTNSEIKHKCLFIENPKSKNLEKSVIFKLGAKSSVTFVIVIKAPKTKKLDFLSFIKVTHIADGDTERHVRVRTEKRISSLKAVLPTKVPVKSELRVLVIGKLENPQLYCCKSIFEEKAQ